MSNLHEILEICLQEIENGADVDSVLFRYPAHADELRPILEASVKAKEIAVPAPSSELVRRNRARVLQHAALIREAENKTSRRLWSVPMRRALVTLVVIGVLFMSSTNLVRAASTTIPGDNLYPVKRSWENMLILFTFNSRSREALEVEHENERLDELSELFAEGRSVEVDFSGLVTRQNGDLWLVAGIPVAISPQTDLPPQPVAVGDAIHVVGTTQKDGAVLAQMIEMLPAGVALPEVEDDDLFEFEQESSDDSNQAGEDNSGKGSVEDAPKMDETQDLDSESESESSSQSDPKDQSVRGVIESINGKIIVVDGQIMNVSSAEVKGTPRVGSSVKVEGFYNDNGLFIVTKIEFENGDSEGSDDSNNGGEDNSGGDANDNNEGSGGDNDNDSDNKNEDNSGSNDNNNDSGDG